MTVAGAIVGQAQTTVQGCRATHSRLRRADFLRDSHWQSIPAPQAVSAEGAGRHGLGIAGQLDQAAPTAIKGQIQLYFQRIKAALE